MSAVSARLSAIRPSVSTAASQAARARRATGVADGLSADFHISTATGEETLTEALARIGAAVDALE